MEFSVNRDESSGVEASRLFKCWNAKGIAAKSILDDADQIINSGLASVEPPKFRNGLVIGYVQSGKTASFTAVTALARDRGFRLIVVVSGVTTNLFNQSLERMKQDLQADLDRERWLILSNPRLEDRQRIEKVFKPSQFSIEDRTVVMLVMKNVTHLKNLATLLSTLGLETTKALIIDDEADQASLNNNVRKDSASATYTHLVTVKSMIPHHLFLQYTATPQAPLLINISDAISPDFVKVLEPGNTYTGGRAFFGSETDLIRNIPDSDLEQIRENGDGTPPDSLIESLAVFFVGVAIGIHLNDGSQPSGNRSMMVHPDKHKSSHALFVGWVRSLIGRWSSLLETGMNHPQDPDFLDVKAIFTSAIDNIRQTYTQCPSFNDLHRWIGSALEITMVEEVNTRLSSKTKQIDWGSNYSFILVGGEVLNRGYTIEGLTVSYLSRGTGTGQADTIQQRARWFGYKDEYLNLCRVYISGESSHIYQKYVQHEEQMRSDLKRIDAEKLPLKEWKRAFLLDPKMQPTRRSVMVNDLFRVKTKSNWIDIDHPTFDPSQVESNNLVFESFLDTIKNDLHYDTGHAERTKEQVHLISDVIPLKLVAETLLQGLQFSHPKDVARLAAIYATTGFILGEDDRAHCCVYSMSQNKLRSRSIDADSREIKNLFQGINPKGSRPGPTQKYPGDQAIFNSDLVTIQIHHLEVSDGTEPATEVYTLAIRAPKRATSDWVVQL